LREVDKNGRLFDDQRMLKNKPTLGLLTIILGMLTATLAFADADHQVADHADHTDQNCDGGDCHSYRSRVSISLSPKWYHVTKDNYSPAFTSNGFNAPSDDRFGLGALLYWTTPTEWQLGIGVSGFSLSQDVGSSEASYEDDYLGFYFAKNFTPGTDFDLTLGSLVGVGYSQVEVFSSVKNGKFTETAAVIEPTLGWAYRVSRGIKLGLTVSYLVPFAPSTEIKGEDLGINHISAQGFSVGGQVIIGRFDLVQR
jgi:hypothetical protein